MKAMVLRAPEELIQEDVVSPILDGRNRLLIRVTHTGICGTDLKIYRGAIAVRHPLIMGHEVVGEVVDSAKDEKFRAGDRVIIDPMISCGTCFQCRVGQSNLCPSGLLVGRDADGGFAEYIAVPAANVFHLPTTIDSHSAPLIQVMATCLHSQRSANIFPGESVVVLGLGVTGQLQLQLAKIRGSNPVIGVSRSPFKRDLAGRLGADLTIEAERDAVTKVLQATNGRGADLVIETTGIVGILADAIRMVRTGGRLLLFGIYTASVAALPFYSLYFKELTLFTSRAAKGEDYDSSVELVALGKIKLAPLVTHSIPLAELKRGIEMNRTDTDERLKVIVKH